MALPFKHIASQGPVLAAMGKTALLGLQQQLNKDRVSAPPVIPGPLFEDRVAPRDRALVRDYVRYMGGDPSAYKTTLPPHMFPQWGYAQAARTLEGIPYPVLKVLNGGCRLEINAPLPQGEPLHVTACLDQLDDNGRRAVMRQRIATGTSDNPDAVVGYLYVIVPLGGGGKGKGKGKGKKKGKGGGKGKGKGKGKKEVQRVPVDATEIGYWKLGPDAGLTYAMLSGDFNPVHWIRPYARTFGFKSKILHGFATMARAMECLNRTLFSGDVSAIKLLDVQFLKPLVLPARVGCYLVGDGEVYMGDASGGPAYLKGTFATDRQVKNNVSNRSR